MNPFARLRAWYNDPDQFIARAEVAWFRGWMRRRGWIWMMLIAPPQLYFFIRLSAILVGWAGYTDSPLLQAMSAWDPGATLLGVAVLIWMLERRSLAPFVSGRVEELRLTPLRPDQLWPGFLAAPILFWSIWVLIRCLFEFVIIFRDQVEYAPGEVVTLAQMAFGFLTRAMFMLVGMLTMGLGIFAGTVRVLMGRRGIFRVMLTVVALAVGLEWINLRVESLALLPFRSVLTSTRGPVAQTFSHLRLLISLGAWSVVAIMSLRWLRSEKCLRKALGGEHR